MKTRVAVIVRHFHKTGITSVIMNYCLSLNKAKIDLTILAGNPIDHECVAECKRNGIRFVELGESSYYSRLKEELSKEHYDVAHIHGNSCLIYPEVRIARKSGTKTIITHSHNSTANHKVLHYLLRPLINRHVDVKIACGDLAGKWMYGKNSFIILNNGINLTKYKYDNKKRSIIRKQLRIEPDRIVIGHIGRFNDQKNQKYLLDIMKNIQENNSQKVELVLVGAGMYHKELSEYAKTFDCDNRIHFIGEVSDASKYYDAFDVFAMPSLYEGMPVVAIEAQANGLKCIMSDKISQEINKTGLCTFLPLDSMTLWIEEIEKSNIDLRSRELSSHSGVEKLTNCGYDVVKNASKLEEIYLNNG